MMGEAKPGRAETRGEGWGWSAPGECEVLATSQKNAETKRQVRSGFFLERNTLHRVRVISEGEERALKFGVISFYGVDNFIGQ